MVDEWMKKTCGKKWWDILSFYWEDILSILKEIIVQQTWYNVFDFYCQGSSSTSSPPGGSGDANTAAGTSQQAGSTSIPSMWVARSGINMWL